MKPLSAILALSALSVAPAAQCELLFTGDSTADYDQLGRALAMSGRTLLAGSAWGRLHPAGTYLGGAGIAWVFERVDGATPGHPGDDEWVQTAELLASDRAFNDYFGAAVGLTDDTAFLGAWGKDAGAANAGAVYVFTRDDNGTPGDPLDDGWIERSQIFSSAPRVEGRFGAQVALAPERAVVGEPSTIYAHAAGGTAHAFARDNAGTPSDPADDSWVEIQTLYSDFPAEVDQFGSSLAMDDTWLLVGAPYEELSSGAVYVYRRDDAGTSDPMDDTWLRSAKLIASDREPYAYFGGGLALEGRFGFVGAVGSKASGPGKVYEFVLDDGGTAGDPTDDVWVEHSSLHPNGTTSFGPTVALSPNRAAVGCPYDETTGLYTGATYFYERDDAGTPADPFDDSWVTKRLVRPLGDWGTERFGSAIVLDDDVAVVGAPEVDEVAFRGGALFGYRMDEELACSSLRAGANRALFTSASLPVLGTAWTSRIDLTTIPGARLAGIAGYAQPLVGLALPAGELLVDPGSPLHHLEVRATSGGVESFSVPVPNDGNLVGVEVHFQALALGLAPELLDALDLVVGW